MIRYGILNEDKTVTPTENGIAAWSQFEQDEDHKKRVVKQEDYKGYFVSTVFLVLDHSYGGTPLWFKTMIFKGTGESREWVGEEQWRCETWQQAEEQHEAAKRAIDQKLEDGKE